MISKTIFPQRGDIHCFENVCVMLHSDINISMIKVLRSKDLSFLGRLLFLVKEGGFELHDSLIHL